MVKWKEILEGKKEDRSKGVIELREFFKSKRGGGWTRAIYDEGLSQPPPRLRRFVCRCVNARTSSNAAPEWMHLQSWSNPVDPRVLRSRGGNSTPVNCYGGARRPRGLLASRAAGVVETSQRCRIGDEYDQKENSKEARRVPSRNRVSFLLEIWCSLVNLGRRVSKEFAK